MEPAGYTDSASPRRLSGGFHRPSKIHRLINTCPPCRCSNRGRAFGDHEGNDGDRNGEAVTTETEAKMTETKATASETAATAIKTKATLRPRRTLATETTAIQPR